MTRYCIYCGKKIKENDKFCIFCGKPMLSNLPKTKQKSKQIVEPKEEIAEESAKEVIEDIKEIKEEEIPAEEEIEKIEKTIEEKEEKKEVKPLPPEVKEQIDYFLELNDIKSKKKTLADKLIDFQKLVNSSRYETDFTFGENINVQLKAVKSLIDELKQKENELKAKMDDKFIIEKLDADIHIKKSQLKNLMREHKLKKIRDKDVVQKLKEKYMQQLEDSLAERTELVLGIELWIDEIKEEITELTTERSFNKGRFSAKEISADDFKGKDLGYEKQINKLKKKIKTLQNLTKKKKKKKKIE